MMIAIIGPKEVVDRCKKVIREADRGVEIVTVYYNSYQEAPALAAKYQEKTDGIMFVGKTPFKLTEAQIVRKVPWAFLDREVNTLFRAMLEADVLEKKDLRRISFDTYEERMILSAYEDIGIEKGELHIYVAEQRLTDESYHDYLKEFHLSNYNYRNVSCCITGFTEIYEFLKSRRILCVRTTAPKNGILVTYHQIEQQYMLGQQKDKLIVVVDVQIDMPASYAADGGEEYARICNRNHVVEVLYLFASRIEATIIEVSGNEFLLFTTQKVLHKESDDLYRLYLFDLMRDVMIKNISIGIGYGDTVLKARNHAYQGKTEAFRFGTNTAFAVYGEKRMRVPIALEKNQTESEGTAGRDYMGALSKETGISIQTLWKIYRGVKYLKNRDITSKKLAAVCEMSKRNMDRLIAKMEGAGACHVIDERVEGKSGRPTRIIEFKGF